MNHRQKAEELVSDFSNQDTRTILTERISRALKEVEEETWARAVGCLECLAEKTDEPGELGYGIDIGIYKSIDALREEAAKK